MDHALIYEKHRALPKELDWSSMIPTEIGNSSQKKVVNVPKNGTTFQPGSYTLIDISRTPNSVLDGKNSYLRFSVAITSASGTLSAGAWSFLEQVEFSHNAVPIDNIRSYYDFYTAMFDCQVNPSVRASTFSMTQGTTRVYNQTTGIDMPVGTYFFAVPLLTMIAGTMTDCALPTFDMSGYLTARITWANAVKSIILPAAATADATYTIQDIELHCIMNELSEETISRIQLPRYVIPSQGVYNWSTTINSGTVINQLVPFRFHDLRTILVTMRRASVETNRSYYTNARETYSISDYCFLINGRQMPPTKVKCSGTQNCEPFEELRRSFHVPIGSLQGLGVHNGTNYYTSVQPFTATNMGTFMIGLDCETYVGKSNELECGISTLQSDIVFQATFSSDINTLGPMLLSFYAVFGSEIVIENGQSALVY